MSVVRALVVTFALMVATLPAAAQEAWFETGALNPGLAPPPATLDRDTPMGAMESFFALTAKDDYNTAAHLLDLSDLPQDEQAARGTELAKALDIVIERKVVMPWDDLADRPDGWLTGSADNEAVGRVRRSILIDSFDLDDHRVPLRLNRIKPENGEPVWVISRASVENIPALLSLYGPTPFEKSLPDWARGTAFWGMYIWEILLVPVLLATAFLIAIVLYRSLGYLGSDADRRWVRFVARSLRWPAAITVFAAVIGGGTRQLLSVSGILDAILSPVLVIAYVAAITMALVLVIDEIFDRISPSDPNELADPANSHLRSLSTTISAARKAVIVLALLTASGVVLASVNTFETIGFSLLASAGALTIVLGFAAREVLGNILASIQIALNRSARIGDQLIFEGHFCTVERIHFTYVQLLIWNGTRYVVPVSYFVKDAFENWSMEDPEMVRSVELTLAQGADVERMRRHFLDLLEQEDRQDVAPMDDARVHVIGQDAFGAKVRFEIPTLNPATAWEIECKLREALLAEAARIEAEEDRRMLPPAPQDSPEG